MATTKHATEPVTVTIPNATALTGISRSALYRLATAGTIRMVKHGRTTLIPWPQLRAYAEALPESGVGAAA